MNSAERRPDRPAVVLDGATTSYAELDRASARAAALLRASGVRPGDRVGLLLPNVPAFPVLYYAVLRAGAVVVPMNPLLKEREVAYHLDDSGSCLLFAPLGAEEALRGAVAAEVPCIAVPDRGLDDLLAGHHPEPELIARDPADTAVILYTSGTTGRPKGAELTHDNLIRNTEITRTTLLGLTEDDVVLGALPLFHAFGQVVGLNCAVAAGACLTLLPRFDPARALEIIERDRVTAFLGVPTMYGTMLLTGRDPGGTASLRVCVSGVLRCRWRSCTPSKRPSAAPSWKATACPKPHPSPASTTRTAPADPAPSAPRSSASSSACSTRTAPRWPTAGRARSPSAGTTS
ncbi:hypothetical protein GCM10025734_16940 [Kitasatospora paranensis]